MQRPEPSSVLTADRKHLAPLEDCYATAVRWAAYFGQRNTEEPCGYYTFSARFFKKQARRLRRRIASQ